MRGSELKQGAVLLILTLALAAPFFDVPLQRDQGVYAACGSILLHGGAPYRDCWDTKAPMTHYTYALAQAIFGISLAGPVILSAVMAALTGIVLWRMGRRWLSDGIAWSAGLAYSLLLVSIPFDMNAQSEGFANLFIALGAWGIIGGAQRSSNDSRACRGLCLSRFKATEVATTLGAGAALAIAVLYKYTIALPVTAVTVGCVLYARHVTGDMRYAIRDMRYAIRDTLYAAVGFFALLAAFMLYLVSRGALGFAVEHVTFMLTQFPKVTVNPTLLLFPGESGPPLFYLQRTMQQLGRLPVVYAIALAGCVIAIWKRREWAGLLAVWLISAIAVVYPQKVMTLYHWTLAFPALVLCAGALAWEARERRWAVAAIAVAVAANIGYRFYADQWLISKPYLTGQQTRSEFYASQAIGDEIEVAEYVRDRTAPDDLIWIWGNHSIIYYWADRGSPTRFIFNSPLMAAIGENEFQPRWKNEVLESLYAHPPTYIVITWYDRTWFDFKNPVEEFADIPGYQNFLDRYYRREAFMGRFAIHRLTPWWSRLNPPDLLDSVTAIDLLANLNRATLTPAPNQPIEARALKLYDEPAIPTLLMHPEGRAAFNITLPDGVVCFRSDLALDPQSWGWGGDGASFAVAVNGEKIFEQTVGNAEADRFWHPAIVDLSAWAGQTVTLTLSTGPGPNSDFTGDLAGWGLPRLVVSPGESCEAKVVKK